MRKTKKNYDFKWELDWLRYHSRDQADQGEVLDNYCHVTSALKTLRSEDHVIILNFLIMEKEIPQYLPIPNGQFIIKWSI